MTHNRSMPRYPPRSIRPIRLDGESLSSAEAAFMLTWHIEPWETVVASYMDAREAELSASSGRIAA